MKKGFTLIELLAVIVILAIILAITIPSVSNIINSATKGAFESNAKFMLKALNYEMLKNDTFDPTTINESNVSSVLGIDDSNIQTLTVKKINGELYITIVGKNKWSNLTVSGTKTSTRVDNTVTNFSNGANKPALVTGMTPIKWNGTTWVDTTASDTDWYNYDTTNKKWANARTADGSMWVWIPRYIYKISSGWHSNTTGTIDVQFTKGVDDNWNKSVIGNIVLDESANASNGTWTNHPAFTFGNTELTGIWVAKFEATAAEGVAATTSCVTGDDVTTKTIKIVPNAPSWRCIFAYNIFINVRNMETNSTYGWGTTGNGIDTHMMKNTEWGAVAYLSKSNYGQGTNEIWINPARNYTTGCAGDSASSSITTECLRTYDTPNGQQASTTGTIYGIYDLSGGVYEYTASYINNGHTNLSYGSSIISADIKYKNVYAVSSPDDQPTNYGLAVNSKGDALYETSNVATAWFNDYSNMPTTSNPWLIRSGNYSKSSGAGAFNFGNTSGDSRSFNGFRPVLLVSTGL